MNTLCALVLIPVSACAQSDRVTAIKRMAALIDQDPLVVMDTVDAFSIFKIALDGGGEVVYYHRGSELVMLRAELGLSWGRTTRKYYFHNDTIMLVREREELFPVPGDNSNVDHERLITSCEGVRYLWTWRTEIHIEVRGEKSWPGPPDEAEMALPRLIASDPRRKL